VRIHLLDGTYELFRSYFGAPKRFAPDGREVGATAGIIASTLSLLSEPGVTHVAAAFDTVIPSFRNDLYPGYKTGEGVEEDLLSQFPLAERALGALGVVVWPMVEFEADDAMATGARRYAAEAEQVVLLSPDKDLAQCVVGDRVVGFDRRKGVFTNAAGVREKYGVDPESIPDYLALVGDAADGFPGLPGWGAKSTSAVLGHYRHLENIPLDAARWDVPVRSSGRLVTALVEGIADALLFRFLARLRTDVPIVEETKDLEWLGVHREPFEELCQELGLDNLANRPHRWAAL
jgi:5'-3' exonuclease